MIGSVLAAAVAFVGVVSEPEVFSQAGYEADRAVAIEQERVHLVYATATWCPPCQRMKKSTWVDASVTSWVEQHGIVTSLDVDEFPQVAADLGVRAMPTMILFEAGEELGRRTGYTDASELVAWMEAGRNGEELPAPAEFDWGGGEQDAVRQELDTANELLASERYDEATAAYLELWASMNERAPFMSGVRLSYMTESMTFLAAFHPPALEAFTEIRDGDAHRLSTGEVDWDTLTDWVHLNGVIGDYDTTMEWVQRISERPTSAATLSRYADEIAEQASAVQRWDVIAIAIPNPVSSAASQLNVARMMRELDRTGPTPFDDPGRLDWFLRPAVISALHAGDDGTKERKLIEYLDVTFEDSDAWRVTFIALAEECGKLRPEHKAWRLEHDLNRRYPSSVMGSEPEF